MENTVIEEIKKYSRLARQHASFFNWHEKGVKESGIVDYFLDERNHKGAHEFISFSVPKEDPPDAWLYDSQKNSVALEITELVNRRAIDAQIHNSPNYWSECERWADIRYFETQLNERIQEKNEKCSTLFLVNEKVDLLLHSDELWLEACYEEYMYKGVNICDHSFSTIWLLLSYNPHIQSCPVIKLSQNI